MSAEYDLQAGFDPSSLDSITQAQLLQMINQAAPLSNRGGIICFDGAVGGAAGIGFPDVTNNPRFVRYVWIDTQDRTNPVIKRYKGTYTGTPANPSAMSNLYTDWVAAGVANESILTAMISAVGTTGGINIGKLKRASDGSADASKQYYIVRVDSAGQYIEVVSLDTALADGGGVGLNRLQTSGLGAQKYLGIVAGALAYRYIDPANDISSALGNRIPTSSISPGTSLYLLRTNSAGTLVEWVATNASDLFTDGDIPLSKLGSLGAANNIIYSNGSLWTSRSLGAHANAAVTEYYPGTAMSHATKYIETGVLAARPRMLRATFVCLSAELDYVAGDEVEHTAMIAYTAAGDINFPSATLLWDSANSKLRLWWEAGAQGILLQQRNTVGHIPIDTTKWAGKIIYWA